MLWRRAGLEPQLASRGQQWVFRYQRADLPAACDAPRARKWEPRWADPGAPLACKVHILGEEYCQSQRQSFEGPRESCPVTRVNAFKEDQSSGFSISYLWPPGLPGGSVVKNPPTVRETWKTRVWSLRQEDSLQKEMATHSSLPAWETPWTEGPGGLQSTGSQKSQTTWAIEHGTLTAPRPAVCYQSWAIFTLINIA